jgi:hypothetical protein
MNSCRVEKDACGPSRSEIRSQTWYIQAKGGEPTKLAGINLSDGGPMVCRSFYHPIRMKAEKT